MEVEFKNYDRSDLDHTLVKSSLKAAHLWGIVQAETTAFIYSSTYKFFQSVYAFAINFSFSKQVVIFGYYAASMT